MSVLFRACENPLPCRPRPGACASLTSKFLGYSKLPARLMSRHGP
jgi:hypothetical protein